MNLLTLSSTSPSHLSTSSNIHDPLDRRLAIHGHERARPHPLVALAPRAGLPPAKREVEACNLIVVPPVGAIDRIGRCARCERDGVAGCPALVVEARAPFFASFFLRLFLASASSSLSSILVSVSRALGSSRCAASSRSSPRARSSASPPPRSITRPSRCTALTAAPAPPRSSARTGASSSSSLAVELSSLTLTSSPARATASRSTRPRRSASAARPSSSTSTVPSASTAARAARTRPATTPARGARRRLQSARARRSRLGGASHLLPSASPCSRARCADAFFPLCSANGSFLSAGTCVTTCPVGTWADGVPTSASLPLALSLPRRLY